MPALGLRRRTAAALDAVPGARREGRVHRCEDFDRERGLANAKDNCLLVPNPGQEKAVRPAGASVEKLADEWNRANPKAAFRTNAELGEACCGLERQLAPQ